MKSFAILKNKEDIFFNKIYTPEDMKVWFELEAWGCDCLKIIQPTENTKYSIEEACGMINDYYDNKISKLKDKLKPVDYECYKQERDAEKNHQIMKTAHNMVVDYQNGDIDEFINRLKVVCRLKKELYSERIPQITEARKFNGTIKYQIKELERKRDERINYLLHTIGGENENLHECESL